MLYKKNEVIKKIREEISSLENYSPQEEILLVEMALNKTKEQILLAKDFDEKEYKKIMKVMKIRKSGKPLDKIFHCQNFYGIDFFVNDNVLSPRKETEILVERAINFAKQNNLKTALDMCSGSGCIGLTFAREILDSCVTLVDKSFLALKVTKLNAKRLKLKNVLIKRSDMFCRLKSENKFDIIMCNPPYIDSASSKVLHKTTLKNDPIMSLDGGDDGLKFYRILAKELKNFLSHMGRCFLEIGYNQGEEVKKIFEDSGFKVNVIKDYSNLDRVVEVEFLR